MPNRIDWILYYSTRLDLDTRLKLDIKDLSSSRLIVYCRHLCVNDLTIIFVEAGYNFFLLHQTNRDNLRYETFEYTIISFDRLVCLSVGTKTGVCVYLRPKFLKIIRPKIARFGLD